MLDERRLAQNALPNVLPHQPTEKACDALSQKGIDNPSIRLPVWAASETTSVVPEGAIDLDLLPFPDDETLRRHETKLMPSGRTTAEARKAQADHRRAVRMVREARDFTLKTNGEKAAGRSIIRPQTMASPRRHTTPEMVEQVLSRHAKGMRPYPISVQLNVSEGRVKKIIQQHAA